MLAQKHTHTRTNTPTHTHTNTHASIQTHTHELSHTGSRGPEAADKMVAEAGYTKTDYGGYVLKMNRHWDHFCTWI